MLWTLYYEIFRKLIKLLDYKIIHEHMYLRNYDKKILPFACWILDINKEISHEPLWGFFYASRLSIFMWIKKIYESCDDIQQLIEMIIRGYFSFEIATLQTHAFYSKLHHNHTNRYVYNSDNTKVPFPSFW